MNRAAPTCRLAVPGLGFFPPLATGGYAVSQLDVSDAAVGRPIDIETTRSRQSLFRLELGGAGLTAPPGGRRQAVLASERAAECGVGLVADFCRDARQRRIASRE